MAFGKSQYKYYLNHVGYKVVCDAIVLPSPFLYYLNHVGYKEIISLSFALKVPKYYLNHVGYKERFVCASYLLEY